MAAEDWMTRGYLAGIKGEACEPPNYPVDQDAYMHGWRNGEDDRNKRPRASAAQLRERAANILAMDDQDVS